MGDREVDQQLVERAQRGDKRAFELLVLKYQRKLGRLLSRLGARPGGGRGRDAGSLHQGVPRAAELSAGRVRSTRGCTGSAINTAKNYLVALGRRAPTSTGFDNEEAEGFEDADQLRDCEHAGKRAARQGDRGDGEPRDGCAAEGFADRDHAARDRGAELRGDCRA